MGLFSGVGRFLFGKNPAEAANPYLEQIPGMAREQYNPYIQQGQQAYENMNPVLQQMTSDPTGYMNEMQSQYKPSTGYDFMREQAMQGAQNTAAARGYSGTPEDERRQAELASGLAGGDMQNWMNNVLGVQGAGMEGQSRIQQQGFQGTQSMADMLGGTLNSQASLAFQGQKQKNQQQQDFMKFIGQMAASAAGMPGAGGATGGASTPR